jgi:hypothetical protein
MNKRIVVLLLLLFPVSRFYAQDLNRIIPDPKTGEDMLYGYCNREGLSEDSFGEWFKPEYEKYVVDQVTLSKLDQEQLQITGITVVMGTWCSDSRREIPRFIKIIDELGLEVNAINMICVDRARQADVTELADLQIELVPTIILSREDNELGRIIESPKKSLEADMVDILSK